MATKTQTKVPAKVNPPKQQYKEPEVRKPSTAVAETKRSAPPAALAERMSQDAGKGVSTDQADNLVPLIYLLQPLSPQVMRGNQKQIEGAQPGDIWLRNAPEDDQIISADDGLLFQPCYFSKDWVEWLPKRAGFVARHATRPEVSALEDVEGDDGEMRKMWRMPNGNSVVETRYHVGFAIVADGRALPYTIPLSSTGHTVSKAWMFQMNSESLPDGSKAPSFAILYRLVPKLITKNNKSWYQYEVKKEGWVETVEEYERGLALYEAFSTGAKQVAEESSDYVSEEAGVDSATDRGADDEI